MSPDATIGLFVAFGVMFTATVVLFLIIIDDVVDLTKRVTPLKERVARLESQINARDLRASIAKHLTAQASLNRDEGKPN